MTTQSEQPPRRGDDSTTVLSDSSPIPKTHPRLRARGDIEELDAALDAAVASATLPRHLEKLLHDVHSDLVELADAITTPTSTTARPHNEHLEQLQSACEQQRADQVMPPESSWPSTTSGAALLRSARTVARRAERSVWGLVTDEPDHAPTRPAEYLNRLSGLLLLAATWTDREAEAEMAIGGCMPG